jgi:aconitate decarboxylase
MSQDVLGDWLARFAGFEQAHLPASARAAVRRFLLDSMGVGVAGSRGPYVESLIAHYQLDAPGSAPVWGAGARLGASAAALVNAYQIHNAEYDCVHEDAVVHPMAVVLGAMASGVHLLAGEGERISGARFECAVAMGVEFATSLGVASSAGLRFFRPATAGALGGVIALSYLAGLTVQATRNALGIALGQLCGTMQAHTEGSPVLAMQVGFNARNAVTAWSLARVGIPGPQDVLAGPFGFFALFEGEFTSAELLRASHSPWRIEQVAHKPFPSGRATHGIVEACLDIRRNAGLVGDDIDTVRAEVPPLTARLVGRPVRADMNVNYARLSGPFVAAIALCTDDVAPADFEASALEDSRLLELGRRIEVLADGNEDPNALTPITVTVREKNGTQHVRTLSTIYGHPDKPMSRDAWVVKFTRNLGLAREPLAHLDELAERLLAQVEQLHELEDVSVLFEALRST